MVEDTTTVAPERMKQIIDRLRKRVPDDKGVGCILCKWILEDLLTNEKLSGAILDAHKQPMFPRSGELAHLQLEGVITSEEKL